MTAATTQIVMALGRDPADVASAKDETCEHATSYGARILTLRLRSGERLRLFVKDLGGGSRLAKDDPCGRRERELHVYRDLLAGAGLGTADLHGTVWDNAHGRFWLLLEHVDGLQVRYCAVDAWVDAVGWLGRLQSHARTLAAQLAGSEALLRHDAAYFASHADAAIGAVSELSPSLERRVRAALAGYEATIARMTNAEPTLVHGAYRPQNILVADGRSAGRVCPVDWELAALGHPLYDISFIVDGFAASDLRRLLRRYREEAQGGGVPAHGDAEALRVVDCFRLHRTLMWLGHSVSRRFPRPQVEAFVAAAEELSKVVVRQP